MPEIFTFSIPKCFNFTFRAGFKPVLSDGTLHVESDSNDNRRSDASNDTETLGPSPSHGTGNTDSSPCGTLSRLPLELKIMIYRRVLKSEKTIRQAHKFLDPHPPFMVAESSYIDEINAAILRTCRTIYQEAIHILYSTNRFHFRESKDVEKFGHCGLGNTPFGIHRNQPPHAVGNTPYGRLTMIRFICLRIAPTCIGDDRKGIWSSWSNFFYPSEHTSKEQGLLVGFPALERLVLDFTDLHFDARDTSRIRVTPFLKKLRPTDGLKHLTLIGVKHEQNLRDFKYGFVRQGGTFREASMSVKTVPTFTVTPHDLPEVSMYVRAIVDKDRASRAILHSYENAALAI